MLWTILTISAVALDLNVEATEEDEKSEDKNTPDKKVILIGTGPLTSQNCWITTIIIASYFYNL